MLLLPLSASFFCFRIIYFINLFRERVSHPFYYVFMSNQMICGYGVRLHQHNNDDDDDDFTSFFLSPPSLSLVQFCEMLPFSDHCDMFRLFDVSLCRTLRSN